MNMLDIVYYVTVYNTTSVVVYEMVSEVEK